MTKKFSVRRIRGSCEEVSNLLKALSHPQRLMILGHLVDKELTVTELQKQCGISQSQLSQFLARMKWEKIIHCRREGKFRYYFIADNRLLDLMHSIQNIYCKI